MREQKVIKRVQFFVDIDFEFLNNPDDPEDVSYEIGGVREYLEGALRRYYAINEVRYLGEISSTVESCS